MEWCLIVSNIVGKGLAKVDGNMNKHPWSAPSTTGQCCGQCRNWWAYHLRLKATGAWILGDVWMI